MPLSGGREASGEEIGKQRLLVVPGAFGIVPAVAQRELGDAGIIALRPEQRAVAAVAEDKIRGILDDLAGELAKERQQVVKMAADRQDAHGGCSWEKRFRHGGCRLSGRCRG